MDNINPETKFYEMKCCDTKFMRLAEHWNVKPICHCGKKYAKTLIGDVNELYDYVDNNEVILVNTWYVDGKRLELKDENMLN